MSASTDVPIKHSTLCVLRVVTRAMFAAAAILATIVFIRVGPQLEVLISPVIPAFEILKITHDTDGTAVIHGALMKARGREHCTPTSLQAFTTDHTNPSKQVILEFEVPSAQGHQWVTRPSGAQEFGPWRMHPPRPPIGPLLLISVTHRCHFLWPTTQTIYSGPSKLFFPDSQP